MSRERRLEKALTEEKYRCRMVKSKKNWIIKGMLFSTLLLSGLAIQTSVYADNWTANTPESIQIEDGATSYTLKEGDTLWAISQVTNIKVETLAEINNIDLSSGEQYTLEIGRVIHFDGNHVTVKDSNGNVVADKVLDDTDKVDTSKTFNNQTSDTPKNSVQPDSNGNVKIPTNSGSNQNSSGNSDSKNNNASKSDNNQQSSDRNEDGQGNNKPNENKPTTSDNKPVKPTEPVNPVNPEKPAVKEYSVSVIHKDTNGNILEKEADIKVKDGESYTAKAKEFDNYTLEGQPTQTVKVDSNKVITFIYQKNEIPNPAEKFEITVKYVDENNKEIAESDNLKVENGQNYTATAKTIEGYSLVGEVTQSLTVNKNETIAFKYHKNETPTEKFNITVKFEDEDGKELSPFETHELEKGQVFTAQAKDIADYSLVGENSQAITVTGDETITFKYVKDAESVVKYPVIVEYRDEDGNLLGSDSAIEVEKGKSFTAIAKSIDGYILVGEATQTITVDKSATITFTYKKDETSVTVDKTELQNLVNSVQDTAQENFTDESFADFKTVLDKANSILNDNDATQEQVNQAKSDLQNAFDNLTENEITVDKSTLEQLINSVKETPQGNYTDESYTNFTTELTNANTILRNPDAAQFEVDTAKANLQTAFDNLVEKTTGGSLSATEMQIAKNTILREVNNLRASYGLEPVISEDHLNRGADTRAVEIETLFDHIRPDGSGVEEAVMEQGAFPGIFGENIASNSAPFTDGEQAGMALFNQWKNSSSHLSLMLTAQMKYIGIGINSSSTGIYGVQLMSVMLYDNDTDEPLYPDTKTLKEQEVTQSGDNLEQTEKTVESMIEQSIKETVESEQNEQDITESSVENETYETSSQLLTVNKDELKETYNLVISLDEKNYTVHSWSNLMFKVADAKQVFDNADVTQQQVDDAVFNLQKAINDLV